MLYYGERKKGCRCLEVILHGYRTLIIENDVIRVMLLLDKGTDIISYVHKATDTDFVWTNPMGLSCLEKRRLAIMDADCYSDNYVGGMFEILPNFGSPCECNGMHFPQHSEASLLPWEVQIVEDSAERMVFRFTVKLSKMPLMLTKTLIITNDSMALRFEEELKNIGSMPVPYLWAWHPCIGEPFLNSDCQIELPFHENIEVPMRGAGRGFFDIYKSGESNYATIRNTKTGFGIGFSFDPLVYTHCAVWIDAGGGRGHHKWNGSYVVSVLPCNSEVFTLSEAIEKNRADVIDAGEVRQSWYTMTLFQKNESVKGISKDGKVI